MPAAGPARMPAKRSGIRVRAAALRMCKRYTAPERAQPSSVRQRPAGLLVDRVPPELVQLLGQEIARARPVCPRWRHGPPVDRDELDRVGVVVHELELPAKA